MSLRYMGVSSWCKHAEYEDRCELCKRDRKIKSLEAEIERLRAIINAKLHRRKCHDCGHVGWYVDSRTPYCLCDQCRSQDTRRVKEAT